MQLSFGACIRCARDCFKGLSAWLRHSLACGSHAAEAWESGLPHGPDTAVVQNQSGSLNRGCLWQNRVSDIPSLHGQIRQEARLETIATSY